MTAQATQSNNALGRRSLPSSFFAPLQTLGRYMERQRIDGSSPDGTIPDGTVPGSLSADLVADEAADSAIELEPASGFASTAFADVARRVWSETAPELRTADRAVAAPTPNTQPDAQSNVRPVTGHGPEEAHALAHDASNLLSALRLYSELLCFSGVLHERHRHYAEDLKLLSLRSERLIGRLVELAEQVALAGDRPGPGAAASSYSEQEPDSSGQAISRLMESSGAEITSVAPVLIRLKGLLSTLAHGALTVDLGNQAELPVAVPEDVLERILVNLVSNAAAAIRGGGSIRIRAGVQDDPAPSVAGSSGRRSGEDSVVVLTVDDSGCGMSEAQVQAALGQGAHDEGCEPGRGSDLGLGSGDGLGRGRSATLPARRHGLGLSIVRELVAANRGRLFIHSRPGTGTRIEIHWKTAVAAPLAGGISRAGESTGEEASATPANSFTIPSPRPRAEAGYPAMFPRAGSGEFPGVRPGITRAGTRAATRAEREAEGAVAW